MKNTQKLEALERTEKNTKKLKKESYIPAVLYGDGIKNMNLQVKKSDFVKTYAKTKQAALIDLSVAGKEYKVIIKDVQKDYIKDDVIHIDFMKVNMDKKVKVKIPLNFVGVSNAVKNLGGVLSKNLEEVRIMCLPGDLMESIDVDLTKLEKLRDAIRIKDLDLPESIQVLNSKEELIVNVLESRKAKVGKGGGKEEAKEEKTEEGEKKEEEKKEEEKK